MIKHFDKWQKPSLVLVCGRFRLFNLNNQNQTYSQENFLSCGILHGKSGDHRMKNKAVIAKKRAFEWNFEVFSYTLGKFANF